MNIKTIIVDDEELARKALQILLKDYAGCEVVAECANGFEAIKAVQDYTPQLMFLDIQMPRLDGFDVMELLGDKAPQTIFVTAYDQYALQAFEVNALDYLLKPISKERFTKTMDRVVQLSEKTSSIPDSVLHARKSMQIPLKRIVVKEQTEVHVLDVNMINYIEADDDFVKIFYNKSVYIKSERLYRLEELLDPSVFIRIHRSFLLNINFLHKIEPYTKESKVARLKNNKELPISRQGYLKLKEQLSI